MIKSIFVPFSGNRNEVGALAFANAVAAAVGAKGECFYACKSLSLLSPEEGAQVRTTLEKQGISASQQLIEEFYTAKFAHASTEAEAHFRQLAQALPHNKLSWEGALELYGDNAAQISSLSFLRDLTVASFSLSPSVLDDVIATVLFGTGRAVALIKDFPAEKKPEDLRIVIGWKPSSAAVHVLSAALPLLQKAGKVAIVSIEEDKAQALTPSVDDAAAYLATHGVQADAVKLTGAGSAPLRVQDYYTQAKADLLVMGAYSHSRLRELVFGGFTRHFLQTQACNLLLAH